MKDGMLRLLVSHWLIIPEFLLLILLSMIIVPLALLALFFSIVAGAKFAVLALLGLWGLVSQWTYCFCIKTASYPPRWATIGLWAGILVSLLTFQYLVFVPSYVSHPEMDIALLLSPVISLHWYLIKKMDLYVSVNRMM